MARGRKITLKNYLKKYSRYLSEVKDNRLSSFADVVNSGKYPRCVEPVFLYALTYESTKSFEMKLNKKYQEEFTKLKEIFKKYYSVQEMLEKDENLPMEYKKVYDSFIAYNSQKKAGNRRKKILFEKVRKSRLTVYKMAKLSNLNAGNVYRFIKLNDYTALSTESAEKLYDVLEVKNGI